MIKEVKAMNRTVTFNGPGQVEMVSDPVPKPRAGEVLIKTTRSLISTGTGNCSLNTSHLVTWTSPR